MSDLVSSEQTTDTIFMVRPSAFQFNPQTAASNSFQSNDGSEFEELNRLAQAEFDGAVANLRAAGVNVLVFDDTPEPIKPDAIFPNNWISTHSDSTIVLYPMQTENRRQERRQDLVDRLIDEFGFRIVLDLSPWERRGQMLEGTGSMVLDRVNRTAYACLSPRTDVQTLRSFCDHMNYKPVSFTAVDRNGKPIYHTNVVMAIGSNLAVVCLECIPDATERQTIADSLTFAGRNVLPITRTQLENFAGNTLELRTSTGQPVWALSNCAWNTLSAEEKSSVSSAGAIVTPSIPTIERVGGGSLRCMIAEIFPPARGASNQFEEPTRHE